MITMLILASIGAVGVGLTAAYSVSRENRRIHFVEKNDISEELDDLEIEVSAGEECLVCGGELDAEDVGAVVKRGTEYRAVCSKRKCLDTYDLE